MVRESVPNVTVVGFPRVPHSGQYDFRRSTVIGAIRTFRQGTSIIYLSPAGGTSGGERSARRCALVCERLKFRETADLRSPSPALTLFCPSHNLEFS